MTVLLAVSLSGAAVVIPASYRRSHAHDAKAAGTSIAEYPWNTELVGDAVMPRAIWKGALSFELVYIPLQMPHPVQHADLDPGHAPLFTLETASALVGAAQMDAIELHTWNALTTSMEKPDLIVFVLDPDPELDWNRMIEAVRWTDDLLEEPGLRAWCKTSGGKGLYVVVPLMRHTGWGETRDFAHAVADHLAAMLPERFSAKTGGQNRKGRTFVDYLRNSRGASTIAAYAPGARAAGSFH